MSCGVAMMEVGLQSELQWGLCLSLGSGQGGNGNSVLLSWQAKETTEEANTGSIATIAGRGRADDDPTLGCGDHQNPGRQTTLPSF